MIDLVQFYRDYPELDGRYKEYAILGTSYLPLAANAVQVQQDLTTGMDADFIVTNIYATQTTAATNAAYITTPVIINVVYTTASRNVTNIKLEWSTVAGTQGNPRIFWPYPIVIPRASQISVQCDNPQAVAANVWIAFHGIKVFPWKSQWPAA